MVKDFGRADITSHSCYHTSVPYMEINAYGALYIRTATDTLAIYHILKVRNTYDIKKEKDLFQGPNLLNQSKLSFFCFN